jgi:hypothetical protein
MLTQFKVKGIKKSRNKKSRRKSTSLLSLKTFIMNIKSMKGEGTTTSTHQVTIILTIKIKTSMKVSLIYLFKMKKKRKVHKTLSIFHVLLKIRE